MRDESPLEIPEIFENIETMVFGYLKSVGMSMSMSNVFENPQTSTQPIVQHFLPHLIFWLYKDVYYETAERYTTGALSSNSITDNLEANRRTAERNIKKAVFRKRSDAEANKTTKEYYDLVGHKEQRSNEISPVYHLTKLDYKAVQEYSPSTRNLAICNSSRIFSHRQFLPGGDSFWTYGKPPVWCFYSTPYRRFTQNLG